jgi:polyribonucleotide nucleotidyltransferase
MLKAFIYVIKWYFKLGKKLVKELPFYTLAIITLTLVAQISTLLSFLLPIKIIMIAGLESMPSYIPNLFGDIEKRELRNMILEKKRRIDGRSPDDIRDIWTQVDYLARTHGSAIFTRGETQSLVSVTLGTQKDAQSIDTLLQEKDKKFFLHYNFPPFSTGEVKMMRGVGRREVGHGNLAMRSLKKMMPGGLSRSTSTSPSNIPGCCLA